MTDGLPPIDSVPPRLDPAPPPRQAPALRGALIAGVVAFLVGLVAMALLLRGTDGWPQPAAAPVVQPVAAVPRDATPPPGPDLATLAQREQALSGQLAQLEARLANVDTSADAASGNATRAEGLLVAFAARRALDRGLGLGYVEGQLRERFGVAEPGAVAAVIQASRDPLTLEELRLGLDAIAPDLVTGTLSDGWWRAFRRELRGLIVLRHETTPSPLPADRMLRARRLLDGGQVEGALAEVSRMPGATRAQTWMSAAKRYIDARHALDRIESVAIVGQPASPATPVVPAVAPTAANAPGPGPVGPQP